MVSVDVKHHVFLLAVWAWLHCLGKVHVVDVGHRQTLYLCDRWPVLNCLCTTNFIFVFSSCNPCNSSLHSSFQWLDLNVMGKRNDNDEATIFLINHQPDTRVKLSLVKHNLFYLQTTQKRKDGWWVHSWENYSCWDLHFQTHKELVFFLGGGGGGGGGG